MDPTIIVLFGGAGDLVWRKFMPSLFDLHREGRMPEQFATLVMDRLSNRDQDLRQRFGVWSVEPVTLAARLRRGRSCGEGAGRLDGQAHGGQDLLDGVLGLDQSDEAKRAIAARAGRVDLEGFPEQLAP